MKKSWDSALWLYYLPLAAVGLIYLHCLPGTVQNLDTGELVAGAYARQVVHPPGYPLYIWLEFLGTHLIPFGSIFWRAALLNLVFSVATLALIGYPIRRSVFCPAILLPLAFCRYFWTYAALPDVFGLNDLLCAGIGFVFFVWPVSARRVWWLAVLFGLGAANQHTVLFMLPMVAYGIWELGSWKAGSQALAASAAIALAAYLSLFALDTTALYSWGNLRGLSDLVEHFFRRDYGTFELTGARVHLPLFDSLRLFFQAMISLPFSVMLVAVAARQLKDRRFLVGFFSLLFYALMVVLFFRLPVPSVGERFYLLALVLLSMLASAAVSRLNWQPRPVFALGWPLAGLALLLALVDLSWYGGRNDFSDNTIVEDYARNLLAMSRDDNRAVFVVEGDTRLFSLRYVQTVEQFHPTALVLGLGSIFDPRQMEKIQKRHPRFQVARQLTSVGESKEVISGLVEPNINDYDFYFTRPLRLPHDHLTFLGLGRRVSPGRGTSLDFDSLSRLSFRSGTSLFSESLEYDELKELYSEYAYFDLEAGLSAAQPQEAARWFGKALETVPYCFPALSNLCDLESPDSARSVACHTHLAELQGRERNYF